MAQSKKKNRIKAIMMRKGVNIGLMVLLGILILNQTIQFYKYKDELALLDSFYDKNSDLIQSLSKSQGLLSSFGQDLNDVRKFLLLPTKEYDLVDFEEDVLLAEETEENLTVQLFSYVEKLGIYEKNQELYDANLAMFKTALEDVYWAEHGLALDKNGQGTDEALIFAFRDSNLENTVLFTVELAYDGRFKLTALNENWTFEDTSSGEQILKELKAYVDNGLDDLRNRYISLQALRLEAGALLVNPEIQEQFVVLGLAASTELNSQDKYYYEIKTSDSRTLARLVINKQELEMSLKLIEANADYEDEIILNENAISLLVNALQNGIDTRTALEKLVDEQEKEMESVFADRAFKAVLQELELQMGIKSETETRISYPLLRADGQILRIIYIDKSNGQINVELPDGGEVQTLSMAILAIDMTGKKKLSTHLYC